MPLHPVVLFNIGPAIGGLRIAVRPRFFGLGHAEAFQELERMPERLAQLLAPYPPKTWPCLRQRSGPRCRVIVVGTSFGVESSDGGVATMRIRQ